MHAPSRRFSVTGGALRTSAVRDPGRVSAVKSTAGRETANFFNGSMFQNAGNTTMNVNAGGPMGVLTLLNGLVPESEDMLRKYYRDIYYYDAVAGAAVDLFANFPFSDFSLTGVPEDRLEKYHESMLRLNVRSLMPEIATAYLVDGSFVSSLVFNERDKVFMDLLMYPIDDCKVEALPLYSTDPKIVVRNNERIRRFMQSEERQAKAIRNLLSPQLRQALTSPSFKLDPLTTLYIARRTLPGTEPTSWLKRVLPAYLFEKALFRGTLVEVNKRQRSILHIKMGDDTHEFTPEEMAETVNQFQLADLDPLGAVIGTRNNVDSSEVRQGGDFWKWTDNIDTLTPFKLRALGISEAFLSGDAAYSNVETALSVFMENADAFRSFITYEAFTNKIFPIVAVSNDFFKEGKKIDTTNRTKMTYQVNNPFDLEIPTVRWHKRLEAKSEDNMMDMLQTLTEKTGLPVPIRMWAAGAKVDMESLFHDLEQDNTIRKRIEKITGNKLPEPGSTGDGEDGGGEFASALGRLHRKSLVERNVGTQRLPLLARQFPERAYEMKGKSKTGKDKWIRDQRAASTQVNAMIAKAVSKLQDPNVKQAALKKVASELGRVPNILDIPTRGIR
jgi:hypothetical protein